MRFDFMLPLLLLLIAVCRVNAVGFVSIEVDTEVLLVAYNLQENVKLAPTRLPPSSWLAVLLNRKLLKTNTAGAVMLPLLSPKYK